MSGDLELAVAEGATIVRVGTALFGPRDRGPVVRK
jgi:PLP dependent protein